MSTFLAILSGAITAIPLVMQLVKYVVQATKEKNWNKLLSLTMSLMAEAEKLFQNGADKKRWVLAMVKASADSINYDIDESEISKMIDDLCAMSKVVNPPSVNEPIENSGN
jgi:hypothetical protein